MHVIKNSMRLSRREANLLAAKPSSCPSQVVQAVMIHFLHCIGNTACEAVRSIGGDYLGGLLAFFSG